MLTDHMTIFRTAGLGLSAAAILALTGCTGQIISPTPSPGPLPLAGRCPVLPTSIPRAACPGARFDNVVLTCGGNGQISYSLATVSGGAQRITVIVPDGSVLQASGTPINPLCFDGLTVQIGITFGVTYTGDQGVETGGATPGAPCIVRSRAVFTQFATADPLLSVPEAQQLVKDKIHEAIDTAAIETVFRPVSAPSPARCARWVQL